MSKSNFLSKKSWHARSTKNVAKVHAAELAHEERQKKIIQRQKELTEERELDELKKLHAISSGIPYNDSQVDWIYKTPAAEQSVKANEEYLLGKTYETKKEDTIIYKSAEAGGSLFVKPKEIFPGQKEPDLKSKIRNDPLLIMTMKELQYKKQMRNAMSKIQLLRAKEEKYDRAKKRRIDEHSDLSGRHESHHRRREHDGEGSEKGSRSDERHWSRHHHSTRHRRHSNDLVNDGARSSRLANEQRIDNFEKDFDRMISNASEIYSQRDRDIELASKKRAAELKSNSESESIQPKFIMDISNDMYKKNSISDVLTSSKHYLKYQD